MERCECGKIHATTVKKVICKSGAISELGAAINALGGTKAFVLGDDDTLKAAGDRVFCALKEAKIPYSAHSLGALVAPDEKTIGSAFAHFDQSCDIIVGVGSGVVNDTSKLVSKTTSRPHVCVATAPSMDGYASATSSMEVDGLKTSLKTKCPEIIIGDLDVLKNAPLRTLHAGLGDMIAKYVSVCEWRISHLVTGEYYCERIAAQIRSAVKACVDNAQGLVSRDEKAVEAVFNGLILAGQAMEYAENTRVASGVEHSFSHLWDMRDLAFGTKTDLHGNQCGVATLIALGLYEQFKKITPDREKAVAFIRSFDVEKWNAQLLEFCGKGALRMIEQEKVDGKYSPEKILPRLDEIIASFDEILKIIDEELPSSAALKSLMLSIGAPTECKDINVDPSTLPVAFKAAKDLRDKYILPRLCHDLGVIDDIKF